MPKFSLVETKAESMIKKKNGPTGTPDRWEPDQPSSKEVGKNVGQQSEDNTNPEHDPQNTNLPIHAASHYFYPFPVPQKVIVYSF